MFFDLLAISEIYKKISGFSRKYKKVRNEKQYDTQTLYFQNHLQQKVLDGFQWFLIPCKAEIVSSHEHLESFNSTDSSLRNGELRKFVKKYGKTYVLYLLKKDKTIYQNISFYASQLHNLVITAFIYFCTEKIYECGSFQNVE